MDWTIEKVAGLAFMLLAPPVLVGIFLTLLWVNLSRRKKKTQAPGEEHGTVRTGGEDEESSEEGTG
jgi:hypothetical protein